VDLIEAP